ncbi:hypothetical protein [Sphingomonas sp. NFR15]|uniref:hypothetical protein n=1 Tax=Sphingomonas sp. NFR15 TaxID=1566282 RepID=UPI000890C41F|nr:hypothetical protein [Sphingomonas sp. NFR15]SDA35436.1 hypothetical protein SAMN03159340_03264 [Sphingomonas sp. NFR15]
MNEKTMPHRWAITRRALLGSGAGAAIASSGLVQAATRVAPPNLLIRSGDLSIAVTALSDRAFRVRVAPLGAPPATLSEMLAPSAKPPTPKRTRDDGRTRLTLPNAQCVWDEATGCLSFHDGAGNLLLSEVPGSRHITQSTIRNEPTLAVTQGFASPADERLYGTGCFQDGHLDIRGLPRRAIGCSPSICGLSPTSRRWPRARFEECAGAPVSGFSAKSCPCIPRSRSICSGGSVPSPVTSLTPAFSTDGLVAATLLGTAHAIRGSLANRSRLTEVMLSRSSRLSVT